MADEILQFKGTVVRNVYDSESYKVFAIDANKDQYPFLKFSKYGTCTIMGNLHTLEKGVEYDIVATEERTKYGYSYKVRNIRRKRPNSKLDMQIFLSEILTEEQAAILYDAYPDIVERVIENRLDDIDLNKTKGIKEATFEKIKQKIIDNYALIDLVDEFQGAISLSILRKLYETYPSIEKIRENMQTSPYDCLCSLSRVGFKTADSLLLKIEKISKENIKENKQPIIKFDEDLISSKQRCQACLIYLLEENESNGHTKMDIIKLKNQCERLVPACASHFVNILKECDDIYYDIQNKVVAIKNTYLTERYIADALLFGLKNNVVWNFDYKKYQNNSNGVLTEEQMQALKNLCESNISVLNGSAGTGKTFTTNAIIQMLKDNNKTFLLFSPTGRAAKVLASYTNEEASTIHRGLGYKPPFEWGYNEECKIQADVVIVDEFSMVDIFLAKHLFEAIDFRKTKLLIIGDNAQLPSVSAGNLLHDIMLSKVVPTTTLTKVFRYGEGGLMTVATDTRQCKPFLKKGDKRPIIQFGDNKDYSFIQCTSNNIVNNTIKLYEKLLSQGYRPDDIQVLTAYNKGECGSVALNNHLQKLANKNYGSKYNIKVGEITFYPEDLIIQRVNNYKAELFVEDVFTDKAGMTFIANGEIGVVQDVASHNMIINSDKTKVNYSRDDIVGAKLGYSISIHSSQGGSSKIIILLTPRSHIHMLNSNLIYVGLTRTKEKCFHLGDIDTVNQAIKKKENFNRQTFLAELLCNKNNYIK